MVRAFDPALPLVRPFADSLRIYGKRLAILLGVALGNGVLLAILWLNAVSPLFSAIAVSVLVIAVGSAFLLRTSEGRLSFVYLIVLFQHVQILLRLGREKFRER